MLKRAARRWQLPHPMESACVYFHTANRLEILAERLAHALAAQKTPPFTPQTVVVGAPSLALWLQWQLAQLLGIAAHIEYPLLGGFLWSLARQVLKDLPAEDPLSRERLTWRLYEILPAVAERPGFLAVRAYLERLNSSQGRFELAQRLADVYDRYLYYRPDWILAWERGEHPKGPPPWQGELWRCLRQGVPSHRALALNRLVRALGQAWPQGLPGRCDLFALRSLPPSFMAVLAALSRHTELHFWLLCPTEHYFADLSSPKAKARLKLRQPEAAELREVGHPLLASWGREGQVLQDLLLGAFESVRENQFFTPPARHTLLGHLQADIFELKGGEDVPEIQALPADDGSLQIHVAHSPLRECQILYDLLLGLLRDDESLNPEDILVLVPKIDVYAPHIEAVFGDEHPKRPHLPWHLAKAQEPCPPLIAAFFELLHLPESRFTRSEILGLLDIPHIAKRFDLCQDEIEAIRAWTEEAQVFWGLDGEQKRALALPETEENTWRQGLERLLVGYALGKACHYEGIAAIPVDSSLACALGKLADLLEALRFWKATLAEPASAQAWGRRLNQLLEAFFFEPAHNPEGQLQRIREACAKLAEQAGDLTLDLELVRFFLRSELGSLRPGQLFQGGVTFCGMVLPGVPFRIIVLLGMNDGDFPRQFKRAEFDAMASHPRPGDPHPGLEDRYLFLETLLAARDKLIISYTGRDLRTNDPIPPSVLVSELLDALDRRYLLGGQLPSAVLVKEHPLQPFSPRNFLNGQSFDPWWCKIALSLSSPKAPPPKPKAADWLPPAAETARDVTLTRLQSILAHPLRHFIKRRLGVSLEARDAEPDREVFSLTGRRRYLVEAHALKAYLKGIPLTEEALRAEGLLPHGGLGKKAFLELKEALACLTEGVALKAKRQLPFVLELEDLSSRTWRISGCLTLWGETLFSLRPAALSSRDVLSLWLEFLIWSWLEPGPGKACHLGRHKNQVQSLRFEAKLEPSQAKAYLSELLEIAWQASHRPLPLPPKTAWAWIRSAKPDPQDEEDPYVALFLRAGYDSASLTAQMEFQQLAEALFGPPLKHGSLSDAAFDD